MASLLRVAVRSHTLISSSYCARIAAFHTYHVPPPLATPFIPFLDHTAYNLPSLIPTEEETIRICGNYDAGEDDEKISKAEKLRIEREQRKKEKKAEAPKKERKKERKGDQR